MSIFQFENKNNKNLEKVKPSNINELSVFWSDKPITNIGNISRPFTINDVIKSYEKIKQLSPIAVEMQVYREGMSVIQNNISVIDDFRKEELGKEHGYLAHYDGIKIVVIEKDSELKINQARILYSDGSNKIINIFN